MIGLGAWSFSEEVSEYGYTRLLRVDNVIHLMLHVSLAMILVGGITFFMSFAGCLGALRENICLLKLVSLPSHVWSDKNIFYYFRRILTPDSTITNPLIRI